MSERDVPGDAGHARLANSASPYLRSHADNPVAWFPWGDEAFAEARRRDVPVLISIGYSTCHWCHVMARESFQDDAIAAVINDGFVAIKVDREEHPEVDAAYLAAAQVFTAHLGWPLTVFATPNGRAFFAGTYFPPVARPPQPGIRDVLAAVREAWTDRRREVDHTAAAVADALARAADAGPSADALPAAAALAAAAAQIAAREDPRFGGFAASQAALDTPKFPTAPVLRFLQTQRDEDAVATRALAAMAGSPLRDAVEGGFFRYATRRDWTIPHYERMLTDNAQLIDVALAAGDLALAAETAGYLIDVLQQPSGGFGAAQDSESIIDGARDEGGYYARDAAARGELSPPAVDGKIVTGWNGLAITALTRAALRLGDSQLLESARWATDAVQQANVRDDGSLARASLDEITSDAQATLEDHGAFGDALLVLGAATGEVAYAVRGRALIDAVRSDDGVVVPGGGDPVLAAHGVLAPTDDSDGASPSGLSLVAAAALSLWLLGAGERYREAAASIVRTAAPRALAEPFTSAALLSVAARLTTAPRQVVIVTDDPADALARAAAGLPADVTAVVTPAQAQSFADAGFTLFEGKLALGGRTTVYDCRDFACRLPVTDLAGLAP